MAKQEMLIFYVIEDEMNIENEAVDEHNEHKL